jgi:hypothetical protein
VTDTGVETQDTGSVGNSEVNVEEETADVSESGLANNDCELEQHIRIEMYQQLSLSAVKRRSKKQTESQSQKYTVKRMNGSLFRHVTTREEGVDLVVNYLKENSIPLEQWTGEFLNDDDSNDN